MPRQPDADSTTEPHVTCARCDPEQAAADRERAARVSALIARLIAEREARGLRRWADWRPS